MAATPDHLPEVSGRRTAVKGSNNDTALLLRACLPSKQEPSLVILHVFLIPRAALWAAFREPAFSAHAANLTAAAFFLCSDASGCLQAAGLLICALIAQLTAGPQMLCFVRHN